MAWWSDKLSLGGLQDIAGAVNKISESVKNIEKNFDSALGLEEKRDDTEEGNGYVYADTVAQTLPPSTLDTPHVAGLHCCVLACVHESQFEAAVGLFLGGHWDVIVSGGSAIRSFAHMLVW